MRYPFISSFSYSPKSWTKSLPCFLSLLLFSLISTTTAIAAIGDNWIVNVKQAGLHSNPTLESSVAFNLNANDKVTEIERSGAWLLVTVTKSGIQGWLLDTAATQKSKATIIKTTAKTVADYASRIKTLEDLGLMNGILYQGSAPSHSFDLFFPTPQDSTVSSGSFRLLYRSSHMLHSRSNVRVLVNDMPVGQYKIKADGALHSLQVPFSASLFRGPWVKVTVLAALLVDEDRCLDERSNVGFFHVLPESSLTLAYAPSERSVRDTWRLLPHTVKISLPKDTLTPDIFTAVWGMMDLIIKTGRKVELTRLPEMGDIVVASSVDLNNWLTARDQYASWLNDNIASNINLLRLRKQEHPVIAVTEPFDAKPLYLLSDRWNRLAAGAHYNLFPVTYPLAHYSALPGITSDDVGLYEIPLARLGLDTRTRYIAESTEWKFVIEPHALPAGSRLERLNLNFVAPVSWTDDPDYEAYIYLNDILLQSARLSNDGKKQHLSVYLPQNYQLQFNTISVTVQHDIVKKGGFCQGLVSSDPIQITPDSGLVIKQESIEPEKFADLYYYLAKGFDVFLNEDFLAHPKRALNLLSSLSADYPLAVDYTRVSFEPHGAEITPQQPFIAIGNFHIKGMDHPVLFDKGRIQIIDESKRILFDVDHLEKISVAQIMESSNQYGLWIKPSEVTGLPDIDTHRLDVDEILEVLHLDQDNVAFLDKDGVLMTVNSHTPSLAQVYYPDSENWLDVLQKYRFWILVFAWFFLTMLVIYLYRKVRSQSNTNNFSN
ncbi:MAG: cellulose biosynthesis cyclic di-GMP-binding regulatory protein BcsB [Mariprofundales bacterium]